MVVDFPASQVHHSSMGIGMDLCGGVMKQVQRLVLAGLFCIGSGIASNLHLNIDVVFFVPVGQVDLVKHL